MVTERFYDCYLSAVLLFVIVLSGMLLLCDTSSVVAVTSVVNTSVSVASYCSMAASLDVAHTASLINGIYSGDSNYYPNGIGKTTITVFCNDTSGFSVYAVGYSGDPGAYGSNILIGANTGFSIPTGTATSGDISQWAMKINKVTDNSAYAPENLTIVNGFDNYHAVPNEYTKVADFSTSTDSTLGSKMTATYAVYSSPAQTADTYVGQVKYTMVHPQVTASPSILTEYGIRYMQDFTNLTSAQLTELKNLMVVGKPFEVMDSRDGIIYQITKLGDDNIWLLDNLALDLTDRQIVNRLSSSNTNASDTTLNYLKNGGGTESDKYPVNGLSYENWTTGGSFYEPMLKTTYKNTVNPDDPISEATTWKYGIYYNYCAASAGSYCYNNGENTEIDATEDICPNGWRMPSGGSNGDYKDLFNVTFYSGAYRYRIALKLPLSGNTNGSGSATIQGVFGGWWSSTFRDLDGMYFLGANETSLAVSDYTSRRNGYSVRCVLDL